MVDGLNELLAELKASGKVDSSGRFTLDLQRALRKLEQFRLPGPHDYLLSLVAAASLSQASRFTVRSDSRTLQLGFDGRAFAYSELEGLFPSLLDEQAPERLRELAVGLHSARGDTPGSVRLESWDGQRGCRLHVTGRSVTLESLRSCPWPDQGLVTRISVRQKLRWRWWKAAEPPEIPLLRERCGYGPLALELAGSRPELPRFSLLCAHRFQVEGSESPLRMVVYCAQETRRPAGFHGVCGFRPGGGEPHLHFVLNGVAYPQPQEGFPPGFCAWIAAPGWRRDLSLASLVHDAAWQRAIDTLHYSAVQLLIEYADSASFLDPLAPSLLWLLQEQIKLAEALNLFPLTARERATLNELKACYKQWGCLWVRVRENPTGADEAARFPDGTPILQSLEGWAPAYLRERFPNFQLVSAGPWPVPLYRPESPRPGLVGENWLAWVNAESCELGLPDRDVEACFSVIAYRAGKLVHQERTSADGSQLLIPNGVVACLDLTAGGATLDDCLLGELLVPQLRALYRKLLMSNPEGPALRRAARLVLECLAKANQQARGQVGSTWEVLSEGGLRELQHRLDLETLVRMAYLPTVTGEWVSPAMLASEPPRARNSLLLTERELGILEAFLPERAWVP